ncbi:hypothetical protein H0E87_031266 [Populus deltoides]|uniref:Uncharacterized protein n=1 Tax=Populus deltoides TaxID=3696 RepID=A0A8T2WMK0_POPDE|nr:hypothetical protein H0E87_031266 [Populus deltoides]
MFFVEEEGDLASSTGGRVKREAARPESDKQASICSSQADGQPLVWGEFSLDEIPSRASPKSATKVSLVIRRFLVLLRRKRRKENRLRRKERGVPQGAEYTTTNGSQTPDRKIPIKDQESYIEMRNSVNFRRLLVTDGRFNVDTSESWVRLGKDQPRILPLNAICSRIGRGVTGQPCNRRSNHAYERRDFAPYGSRFAVDTPHASPLSFNSFDRSYKLGKGDGVGGGGLFQ